MYIGNREVADIIGEDGDKNAGIEGRGLKEEKMHYMNEYELHLIPWRSHMHTNTRYCEKGGTTSIEVS